jgi:hypothetical protein
MLLQQLHAMPCPGNTHFSNLVFSFNRQSSFGTVEENVLERPSNDKDSIQELSSALHEMSSVVTFTFVYPRHLPSCDKYASSEGISP